VVVYSLRVSEFTVPAFDREVGTLPVSAGNSWMMRPSIREVNPMEKAQARPQTEVSPAVAMLVVILVLVMAVGMVLYAMQHGSIGNASPGSSLSRGRAISPTSRGTGAKSQPTPAAESAGSSAASQKH